MAAIPIGVWVGLFALIIWCGLIWLALRIKT